MKSASLQQQRPSPEDEQRAAQARERIDSQRIPRHIAITMDGNGRWAREHGYSERTKGHEAAIGSVRAVVEGACEIEVPALTLYAFSTENWSRPRTEVSFLMRLLQRFLIDERKRLMKNNIRMVHSGRMDDLPKYARMALERSIRMSAGNTGLNLNLAISYGGRQEIVDAAKRFAREVADGKALPGDLDMDALGRRLYHPELGDPDLMIRTSGEMRVSNFLLWQMAYAEFYVTPTLWPDFGKADLFEAIVDFQKRKRRFGAVH